MSRYDQAKLRAKAEIKIEAARSALAFGCTWEEVAKSTGYATALSAQSNIYKLCDRYGIERPYKKGPYSRGR